MIKIGEYNNLKVARKVDFGYYLVDNDDNDILLPNSSLNNQNIDIDEDVDVFVYRDSEDRPVATLKTPKIQVGKLAYLEVVGQSSFGAFADMGLERDIFIPIKEQKFKLLKGKKYLFYAYLDKTGRMAATTFVDEYIDIGEGYNVDDDVTVVAYGRGGDKTIRVAIDGKYKAIILANEHFKDIYPGDIIDVRIKKIYEDGVIGVTPRKKRFDARNELEAKILQMLEDNNGFIPYNDKTSSEVIREVFSSSKNYFKIALGGLMKIGKITQDAEGTHLK